VAAIEMKKNKKIKNSKAHQRPQNVAIIWGQIAAIVIVAAIEMREIKYKKF
jgi:hypothetical protein